MVKSTAGCCGWEDETAGADEAGALDTGAEETGGCEETGAVEDSSEETAEEAGSEMLDKAEGSDVTLDEAGSRSTLFEICPATAPMITPTPIAVANIADTIKTRFFLEYNLSTSFYKIQFLLPASAPSSASFSFAKCAQAGNSPYV